MNKQLFESVKLEIEEEGVKQAVVRIIGVGLDVVDGDVLHQELEFVAAGFHAKNRAFAASPGDQLVFNKFYLK